MCLKNIDRCRPFFLGLIGQRRGWVPEMMDVNENTLKMIEKTEDKDYYIEKVLQGDLGIVIHEAFRKKEPIFYRVACTEGLML